ncbi:hypothetical protein RF11_01409 [Thelohanellus kitauei]|uniref:Uncharacterized protein n=1 Tax=Thelohanellus kitauei TaxID=669202 RepID=A0A0C2J1W1_THEKT|nr:hypothetical protein RF11_01409 [Thelohanellus kitauei]
MNSEPAGEYLDMERVTPLASSFDTPASDLTGFLEKELMISFSRVQVTSVNLASRLEGLGPLFLRSQKINFCNSRYFPNLYRVFVAVEQFLSVEIRLSLAVTRSRMPHRTSRVNLGCKLNDNPMQLAMWTISELLKRSTTDACTAAVDLCLKGSKDQCWHPSASEESRRVSQYPEGKRAIKINSGACGLS